MRGQNSHRYMRKILWNNTFTVAIENTTPFSKASVLACQCSIKVEIQFIQVSTLTIG